MLIFDLVVKFGAGVARSCCRVRIFVLGSIRGLQVANGFGLGLIRWSSHCVRARKPTQRHRRGGIPAKHTTKRKRQQNSVTPSGSQILEKSSGPLSVPQSVSKVQTGPRDEVLSPVFFAKSAAEFARASLAQACWTCLKCRFMATAFCCLVAPNSFSTSIL